MNKKIFYIYLFIPIISNTIFAQVGLGTKGVINYPGILTSEQNNIRFDPGFGYGFFIRHDVYSAADWNLDFRYSAVVSKHSAKLPRSGDTNYKFSDFSVDFIVEFNALKIKGLYSGLALNFMSAVSSNRYISDYSDETLYPSILLGYSYNWAEGFDFFAEFIAGFGSTKAGPEKIPITGPALHLGLTMYISE
ncbi:MAG: hypothetical protein H6627_00980 [Calditrichae bacterium]|nr:hypothetical protein [Calditrichia bacterium]